MTKPKGTVRLGRRSDDGSVKKEFVGKPVRRGKAGRPKLRWVDCVESDMK